MRSNTPASRRTWVRVAVVAAAAVIVGLLLVFSIAVVDHVRSLRTFSLTTSTAAPDPSSPRVRLQLKAQPGETYRYEIENNIRVTAPDIDPDIDLYYLVERILFERRVEAVRSDGRMVLHERCLQYSIQLRQELKTVVFDSSNPAHIEAARKDPSMAPLLAFMEMTIRYEQEPAGDIRDFELFTPGGTVDPSVRASLEDMVAQPMVLLPDRAVAILETWDGGKMSKSFLALGRAHIQIQGVLLDLRTVDGERIAVIGKRGTATLEPDPDVTTKTELTEFMMGSTLMFSLQRGRIVLGESAFEATLNILNEGSHLLRLRLTGNSSYREVR